MKNLLLLLLLPLMLLSMSVAAQTQTPAGEPDKEIIIHKFFFEQPVKELKHLEQRDGTKINGDLGENGRTVILYDYPGKGGVNATVIDFTGKEEEIYKTPCDIVKENMEL